MPCFVVTFKFHDAVDSSDLNPGVSGLLYPLQEQLEDFINNINAGFKRVRVDAC